MMWNLHSGIAFGLLVLAISGLSGCAESGPVTSTKDDTAKFMAENPEYAKPQEMIDASSTPGL